MHLNFLKRTLFYVVIRIETDNLLNEVIYFYNLILN
jgi:hypothetical protein